MTADWLCWARELQAVAQSGLRYAEDPAFAGDHFDVERYDQVRWIDVNESPSEAVCREVWEETGLEVTATRLLALWDRDRHDHPTRPFHTWKVLFLCDVTGGSATSTLEASDPTYWCVDDLPELSTGRVTAAQLVRLRDLSIDGTRNTAFD